ncbi:MAG: sterol desaturase family protein, partial [Nitrospinaceae bacterium]
MDSQQIRFSVFLGVFLLMLVLEHFLPRHPRVDSKLRRFGINLTMTGLNILLVRLLFGTAAVGAAAYAQTRGLGVLNLVELPAGLEVFLAVVFLDLMIYAQHVVVHFVPLFWWFHIV